MGNYAGIKAERSRKFWVCIPKEEPLTSSEPLKTRSIRDYRSHARRIPKDSEGWHWDWYRMPNDVFEHKEYPTCPKCKQKYVRTKTSRGLTRTCIFCRNK